LLIEKNVPRGTFYKHSLFRLVPLRGFGGYSRVISNSLFQLVPLQKSQRVFTAGYVQGYP